MSGSPGINFKKVWTHLRKWYIVSASKTPSDVNCYTWKTGNDTYRRSVRQAGFGLCVETETVSLDRDEEDIGCSRT